MTLLLYPLYLFLFWYTEAPLGILKFFRKVNLYLLQLLSVQLFLKTFLRPAKMEYREGLVGISIILGIAVKTIFLIADAIILSIIVAFEILFFALFLSYPILVFSMLFL